MSKQRSFLKWAGNKYQCIEHLLSVFPPANRLIEPFAGSAAVFMNTAYPKYLIAEKNQDLIYLFLHLQAEGNDFILSCKEFFVPNNNTKEIYISLREQFNHSNCPRQRAQLFLYLNRHGFNGLCRYNKQGIYNVPFGLNTRPYFPKKEMELFHVKSKNAEIIHADFIDTFALAKAGDIIYCDPPYSPKTEQSNFTSYTSQSFGIQEQIKLAQLAQESAQAGITVIISNHDTPETRDYYKEAKIYSFDVQRFISCRADKRIQARELLAVYRGYCG